MAKGNRETTPMVDRKTLSDLGFFEIMKAVCEKTTFTKAKRIAEGMRPIENIHERKKISALIGEIYGLIESREPSDEGEILFDFSHLEDPSELLERLEKEGTLTGEELLVIEKLIPAFLKLHNLSRSERRGFPDLKKMIEEACDDPHTAGLLEDVSLEIVSVLDEEGNIKDNATVELRRLRSRLRKVRSEISEKVKSLMDTCSRFLQDSYYTIREGRYVLPVRSEERVHVRGIIHGYSQSGATVFIEPEPLVDDCNRLKIVEGEIQAEEEKILIQLSRLLADHMKTLKRIEELLSHYDYLSAIARFGSSINGTPARLSDDPVLELHQVRHPILMLGGTEVIPNSVVLHAGQGWIISGPNAGGKTILLKTAGLCLLMAYAGIPIPAGEESIVGNFDVIRSVIGDDQSIAQNLSTFSAQVKNLTDVLECTSEKSMVLLDELVTGTEPREGAALAREILLDLVTEKGAAVMAATHFENLKHLSISHESFIAAGMGFDFDTLRPTFRVNLGMPGISGGLVVANRYGLPRHIITRARNYLEEEGGKITFKIEEIEKMKAQLDHEISGLEEKKKEIKGKEKEIEEIKKKLIDRKRKELTAQEAYLTSELRLLHSELKEAHNLLRRRPMSKTVVKSSSKTADKVSCILAPEGKLTQLKKGERELRAADPDKLDIGRRVYIKKLGVQGEIEGFEGKKVRIRWGGKSLIAPMSDIFLTGEDEHMTSKKESEKKADEAGETNDMDDYQNPYNTLDVRGKALDEALIEIDAFIDNVMEMGLNAFYIVHGHGKGILKNGIRRHLRHLKRVENFRPGGKNEGGDGCTVVNLKEL